MDIEFESQIESSERIEKRREQLVQAAIKHFAAKGFHGATIKEIAETAGVSAGLLYSYVEDKEDILYLIFLRIFGTYQREIPLRLERIDDPIQRFCAAVRAYCEAVASNVGATVIGYQESNSLSQKRRDHVKELELNTNKLISVEIENCIFSGYFRSVNVDLITFRVVLLAHGWALKNWYFRNIMSLNAYIEEGLGLFLHALLTPSGWSHWRQFVDDAPATKISQNRSSASTVTL